MGAGTAVLDWRDRLVCSQCGGREIDRAAITLTPPTLGRAANSGEVRVSHVLEKSGLF
jgi:hypothetical protein